MLQANSLIATGIVAEKNKVCLCLGNLLIILLISTNDHISSILSASSSTNISTKEIFINH
jgi:hypothetical protein